jgi:hypothetical protein
MPPNGTELSRSAERGSAATERSAVGWSEMLARLGSYGFHSMQFKRNVVILLS